MKRICFLFAAVLPLSFALAQKPAARLGAISVRAQLLKSVHAQGMKAGETFFLKTSADWKQGDCTILANTLITAQVQAVESKPHHLAWKLLFQEVPCAAAPGSLRVPLLIAMESLDVVPTDGLSRLGTARAEANTITSLFNPSQPSSVAIPGGSPAGYTAQTAYSQTQTFGLEGSAESLLTGQVRGMRGVSMDLPGATPVTTLNTTAADITLRNYTTFLLTFAPAAAQAPAPEERSASPREEKAALRAATAPRPAAAPEEPADFCATADCVTLTSAPAAASLAPAASSAWSVPLARMGFLTRPTHSLSSLDKTASVYSLGADELLLTFDLHTLVHRSRSDQQQFAGQTFQPHNVRAVVLSRQDGRVKLIRDWTVSDDLAPAVWGLPDGRVLAHIGHDLVALGPDLKPQARFPLPGPVLFLSLSPAGKLLLLATVHEQHTAAEHDKLTHFLAPNEAIQEDYDLTGLRADLSSLGTRLLTHEPLQPALLADALLQARQMHENSWELTSTTWAGQNTVLAHLHSGCPLKMDSLPGDLLVVRGCASNESVETWYNVLDSHGKALIKGKTAAGDLLQQAEADRAGTVFAIASSHFDHPVHRGDSLLEAAFQNLAVTVYRKANGQQLFRTELSTGSSQQHTFCLTPGGEALVVLTGDTLESFLLPQPAPAP